ncbi:unnamed protein product [Leuciscus chuanchicus]
MEECEMRLMRKAELKGAIGEASLTGPQQDWGRHVKLGAPEAHGWCQTGSEEGLDCERT